MNDDLGPKGKDTRKRLLVTGFKLFATKGLTDVPLKEILTESGVKKGNFYYYFESKDQFLLETIKEYFGNPFFKWIEDVKKRKGNAKETIEYFFYNSQSYMSNTWKQMLSEEEFTNRNIFFMMAEGVKKLEIMSGFYENYSNTIHEWIVSLLKKEQNDGNFPAGLDPDSFASFIFSSCEGVYFMSMMNPRLDYSKAMDNTFNYIWKFV